MMPRVNGHATSIATALAKAAEHVAQRHATAWDARFHNGTMVPVRVELEDDWVRLDAPDPFLSEHGPGNSDDLWSVLTRNASLPPGVKLAFAVGDAVAPPVRLYGEILLDDAAEPFVRMLDLCAAIKMVAHVWPAPESAPIDVAADTAAGDLATLCGDTGWPVIERDGSVLVELDVPDGFAHAQVTARPDGSVAAAVTIGDAPPTSLRPALALLLLRASGSVRLVRAAADAMPRFEVALAAPVVAATLQHAFAALSVAYRMTAREADALASDDTIAAMYLRQWEDQVGGRTSM